MKKAIKISLWSLLSLGLLASCEPEQKEKPSNSGNTTGSEYTVTAFGINMKMVYVDSGTFRMGATEEQGENTFTDEYPVRTIHLDGYYIGKYEVTQAQWMAVMGTSLRDQRDKANPAWSLLGEGDNYPMGYVNWTEAQEFCQKLSEATGKKFVLPTEAQWEYAARGGNKSQHYKYAGSDDIDDVAWYKGNSFNGTHPVGMRKANELGCYDMSGNVMEWCSDWYDIYDINDTDNPQGPADGSSRIHRGGSWYWDAWNLRVSIRASDPDDGRFFDVGFRVVLLP